MITEPTRITETTSTLLDPILVTDEIINLHSGVTSVDNFISDHSLTFLHCQHENTANTTYKRKIWLYKEADLQNLNEAINLFNWNYFFENYHDVDIAAKKFGDKLMEFAHLHIPNKIVTIRRNDKPWYDNTIRRETRKRDRLKRNASNASNVSLWNKYKKSRNHVNNLIKVAKSRYFNRIETTDFRYNDQKQFWKTIKYFMKGNRSAHIPPLLKLSDVGCTEHVYTDIEKATVLNEYFTSISNFTYIPDSLPDFEQKTNDTLNNINISQQDILDAIHTLKIDKAPGIDGISNRLLKLTSKTIVRPLTILFNKSIDTNCFPLCWKEANVTPLFKKGDTNSSNNYRPVSLLSCVGKLMERVMFKYMYNFLHERNLIYKYQSGFQPGHSTIYQIIEIYDNICKALDEKEYMCMVFCDISKAFDRVWFDGLIHKCKGYGFKNNISDWLHSYLHGRKQRVVLNNTDSAFLPVKAGVPQGSVLGPLLFLLYINDISDNLCSATRLFADDSSIFATSSDIQTIENNINSDLTKLSKWARDWLITFNPNKTEVMFFSNRPFMNYPNITFDNASPEIVDSHKHLGVYFSSNAK